METDKHGYMTEGEGRRHQYQESNRQPGKIILYSVKRCIQDTYAFIARPTVKPQHNVFLILRRMYMWGYFACFNNTTFHNLINQPIAPKNLRTLIRVWLTCILIPRHITTLPDITLQWFKMDLFLRVYFSGNDKYNDNYNPKMYVDSEWIPKDWDIQKTIHRNRINLPRQCSRASQKRGT